MKSPAYIKIRNLTKVFNLGDTKVSALAGIDLDIPEGSFTVIMGAFRLRQKHAAVFAGRSGLAKQRASILIGNDEIARMDENELAEFRQSKVGFVFQSFNLIASMSAEENVAFPLRFSGISAKERTQRSLKVLDEVGLHDRIGHKPTELSGGQQQRVAVARALINDPPLILADEPTGNLDSSSGFFHHGDALYPASCRKDDRSCHSRSAHGAICHSHRLHPGW